MANIATPVTSIPLSFNIPVDLSPDVNTGNIKWKWLGKFSDSYFCFSGKRALPIQFPNLVGNSTIIYNVPTSNCVNLIKVISWITVIIPVIMLISKIAFRKINNFQEVQKSPAYIVEKLIISVNNTTVRLNPGVGLGTFSDGSENWQVHIASSSDSPKIMLRLWSYFTGTTIYLDEALSQQLHDEIEKMKKLQPQDS